MHKSRNRAALRMSGHVSLIHGQSFSAYLILQIFFSAFLAANSAVSVVQVRHSNSRITYRVPDCTRTEHEQSVDFGVASVASQSRSKIENPFDGSAVQP